MVMAMQEGYYRATKEYGTAWFYGTDKPTGKILPIKAFVKTLANLDKLKDGEVINTYLGIEHYAIFQQLERDFDIDY